jgi:polysaccharide pyruvyl transferase WcaK-like protein
MITEMFNPDRALQAVMGSLITARSYKGKRSDPAKRWAPGRPLKLILAGYVGNRNTGADVRVEEMIRQFRHILGEQNLDLTIMTLDPELTQGYFKDVHQVLLPQVFPKFLYEECPKHDGVIACEGSMFKSKFADALSTMMSGALGMAAAERKLSVGYGAEAGAMSPGLKAFVKKNCRESFVICRNQPSRKVLEELGIRTASGTDTAWTFEPSPPEKGIEILKNAGWDGSTPILTICPINPFWWPVKPSIRKFAARKIAGQYKNEHYNSIYFHEWSKEADQKYRYYLKSLAGAVEAFRKEKKIFPVLVAMEQLDKKACDHLNPLLSSPAPVIWSREHNMYDMVSVLRQSKFMVSSRFHAIVTSMPGEVVSCGITMDERIRNLMTDRGHEDLFLEVTEENLEEKLLTILRKLDRESETISNEIGRSVPKQLKLMGEMGIEFCDEVSRVYPEFPLRNVKRSWEEYLPALPATVSKLMEKYI